MQPLPGTLHPAPSRKATKSLNPISVGSSESPKPKAPNIGALKIRIGFGGPLYYNFNKEPPR